MRILVDRHHADLLYSLQRLFEDRLKVDLYIPVGHEWWDEGYWRFGQVFGDDRLAQQYLSIHDGIHQFAGDHYVTFDSSHPERLVRCVTREQFREMEWDFIMPSVQENQTGYARLAKEVGARYLVQVGNTGQHVDWSLDPLVLNTSELAIPEGKGVTIHQEIDSTVGAFRYRPALLGNPHVVRSFVNAFDRLPGYRGFLEVEQKLPDWKFTVHGHFGRDENINPVDRMGEMMATAGWGWHDKPVGDGFGHVIHSWAAVGRPLVGSACYYRGKLAEPFWTPETSIDTTGKNLDEVVRALDEIANDPGRHAAMCAAIRATFDRLVDYRAEADAVRSLLGL